jgi:hypothetical protein
MMNRTSTLKTCAGNSYLRADSIGRSRRSYQEHKTLLTQIQFLTWPLRPNITLSGQEHMTDNLSSSGAIMTKVIAALNKRLFTSTILALSSLLALLHLASCYWKFSWSTLYIKYICGDCTSWLLLWWVARYNRQYRIHLCSDWCQSSNHNASVWIKSKKLVTLVKTTG